ncbi:MAG TPA: hypothetical protein VMB47_11635 [Candidatus Aquilonibacter sp.]|nr:hypothetical protein [Candidatus Aquilonibacter sp.]
MSTETSYAVPVASTSDVTSNKTLYANAVTSAPALATLAEPAQPAPDPPQYVRSVFQTYNWEAYFGYTFLRFYASPALTRNTNGVNLGVVYYPGGKWFGVDTEALGTFGSLLNVTEKFVMAAGGGRVRWQGPRGIEVWAHGLAGYSHFLPQTALGGQSAFAFETGAGVDLNLRHERWAVRLAGDMVGTSYFQTHQYSPKASAGIVIKF